MSSEDDFFVIPVTATFLSPDGFQAAMEKSHNPKKRKATTSHQYLSSGPADEAIEKLLIPGATHKFVMVVVPPSSNNAAAGGGAAALATSHGAGGEGLSIVEQMEAKLRAAGYTPKPIRSDRRSRRHRGDSSGGRGGRVAAGAGDASEGEEDDDYTGDGGGDGAQVGACLVVPVCFWRGCAVAGQLDTGSVVLGCCTRTRAHVHAHTHARARAGLWRRPRGCVEAGGRGGNDQGGAEQQAS